MKEMVFTSYHGRELPYTVVAGGTAVYETDGKEPDLAFNAGESTREYQFSRQRIRPKKLRFGRTEGGSVAATSVGKAAFGGILGYLNGRAKPEDEGGSAESSEGRTLSYFLEPEGARVDVTVKNLGRERRGLPGLFGIRRTYGDVTVAISAPYSTCFDADHGGHTYRSVYPGWDGGRMFGDPLDLLFTQPRILGSMNEARRTVTEISPEIRTRLPKGNRTTDYERVFNTWRAAR